MAIFDEAYQYVVDDTGRPEMVDVIKRRIQRATLAMHRIDFWKQDLVEQLYNFQYTQAVQLMKMSLLPRTRSFAYVRNYSGDSASLQDPSLFDGAVGDFYIEMNPQMSMDGYGYDKKQRMYRSADQVKLLANAPISQVLVGRFVDPLLSPIEACDSWILEKYPSLIAAHAKRRIFKDIGKDEEYRSSNEEFLEELNQFTANNIRLAVLQMPG